MRLNKRTISALILLVVISLLGIMGLQIYLLKSAYDQKEEAFKRSVAAVLAAVNDGLEAGEAVTRIFKVATRDRGDSSRAYVTVESEAVNDSISTRMVVGGTPGGRPSISRIPLRVSGNTLSYSVEAPQHVSIHVFDMLGRQDTTVVDTFRRPGEYNVQLNSDKYSKGEYFYKFTTDSASFVVQMMHGSPEGVINQEFRGDRREKVMRKMFDQIAIADHLPIEKRIPPALLDSLISINLKEARIDLPFVYGIIATKEDSVRLASSNDHAVDLRTSEFRARLFPVEFLATRNDLVLYFPDREMFLLRSMAPLIGTATVFMAGIVFAFAFTLRTIFRQKRLSDALIEFINNMTHEFKTPISTIALASEAIARPDILSDGDKVLRYNGIIHDENVRMKQQVEKILQMAVLEEGDYELNLTRLDAHEVIRNAVGNIALQVEQKGGSIACALHAVAFHLNADPVHLANIIHNVLDNANKYSPGVPCIEVSTVNKGEILRVLVRDNGIGMSEEDARKAFTKYFRVSTGNRHDVKGFGLGLSYVKLMVEAHKGTVSLSSIPGRGTTVELTFPVVSKT